MRDPHPVALALVFLPLALGGLAGIWLDDWRWPVTGFIVTLMILGLVMLYEAMRARRTAKIRRG